jgi:hypothetical protein
MRNSHIVSITLGCLFLTVSSAAAEFPWNPLSLIKGSKRESDSPSTAAISRSPGLSFETKRMIVEESRFYPPDQSRMFLDSFESLSDAQAREKLKFFRANRLRNSAPSGESRSLDRGTPQGPSRHSGQASMRERSSSPASAGVNRVAHGVDDLGSQSPWERGTVPSRTDNPASMNSSAGFRREESTASYGADSSRLGTSLPSALGRDARSHEQTLAEEPVSRVTPENPYLPASHSVSPSVPADHRTVVRPARGVSPESRGGMSGTQAAFESDALRFASRESFDRTRPGTEPDRLRRAELSELIERAEAVAGSSRPGPSEQQYQAHIRRHVELRMLYLLAGQRDRAIAAIPEIQENEQAFWTRVFWSLSNYLDDQNYPDKTDRTAAALTQMRSAILSLQSGAHLMIERAAFCTDIESFGNYSRFEKDEFLPGQEILIYAELSNFQSERTNEGKYRTLLRSSVRLAREGGAVDEVQYNATEDLSLSRRQDFMQGFRYQLPQRLAPGNYSLLLTIEDQLSSKSAEYTLKLKVR